MRGHEMNEIPVEPEHVAELSLAEFRCAPGDGVEHGLDVGRRTRDYAQYLGGCCLIFKGFLQLVLARLFGLEQPRVLDGDDGLVGEGGYELNLFGGELLGRRSCHCHDTDAAPISQQRDAQHRSETPEPLPLTPGVFRIGKSVRYVNRRDRQCRPRYERTATWRDWVVSDVFLVLR